MLTLTVSWQIGSLQAHEILVSLVPVKGLKKTSKMIIPKVQSLVASCWVVHAQETKVSAPKIP